MSSYLEQMTLNNAKISELEKRLPALIKSEVDWRTDAQNRVCNQTLKKKREECQKAKSNSLQMAEQRKAEINSIKTEVENLKNQNKTLQGKIEAENLAKVELAKQGQSVEALVIESQGNAQAALVKAGAEAESVLKSTETQNEAKKQTTFLVLGIVAVLAIVVIIFLVKKLKKKS